MRARGSSSSSSGLTTPAPGAQALDSGLSAPAPALDSGLSAPAPAPGAPALDSGLSAPGAPALQAQELDLKSFQLSQGPDFPFGGSQLFSGAEHKVLKNDFCFEKTLGMKLFLKLCVQLLKKVENRQMRNREELHSQLSAPALSSSSQLQLQELQLRARSSQR